MTGEDRNIPSRSSPAEVDAFLRKVAAAPPRGEGSRGRLLFALDATASREPTWDRASHLQAEMFAATAMIGGLEMQVAFYRGFREFRATPWLSESGDLLRKMTAVRCRGGQTQIGRVLQHAIREHRKKPVAALVFVGDAMEEDVDELSEHAGQLGILGVPAFLFQEGHDPIATRAFRHFATLANGAWCPFDSSSADVLRDLLTAAAVYAAGGRRALEDYTRQAGGPVRQLTDQLSDRRRGG
ncbi:MAG: VWA domain-containing protein [Acetobacterales bacterium]